MSTSNQWNTGKPCLMKKDQRGERHWWRRRVVDADYSIVVSRGTCWSSSLLSREKSDWFIRATNTTQSHESTDAERRFTKVRASNRTPTRTTTMLLRKQHWYSLMNCIVDTLLFSFIGDMWHKMWVWDWWQNNTHETNMVKLQKSIVVRLLRTYQESDTGLTRTKIKSSTLIISNRHIFSERSVIVTLLSLIPRDKELRRNDKSALVKRQ